MYAIQVLGKVVTHSLYVIHHAPLYAIQVLGKVVTRMMNRGVYMCFMKLAEFAEYQRTKRQALIKVAGHLVQVSHDVAGRGEGGGGQEKEGLG